MKTWRQKITRKMRNLIFKVYGSGCVSSWSLGFEVKLWKVDSKAYERHWKSSRRLNFNDSLNSQHYSRIEINVNWRLWEEKLKLGRWETKEGLERWRIERNQKCRKFNFDSEVFTDQLSSILVCRLDLSSAVFSTRFHTFPVPKYLVSKFFLAETQLTENLNKNHTARAHIPAGIHISLSF